MKINLDTKICPFKNYSPIIYYSEKAAKKQQEQEEEAAQKAIQDKLDYLKSLPSFFRGGTPDFVIDLNDDLVDIDDIDQLVITFVQGDKEVIKELLFFSDDAYFGEKKYPTTLTDDDGNTIYYNDSEHVGILHGTAARFNRKDYQWKEDIRDNKLVNFVNKTTTIDGETGNYLDIKLKPRKEIQNIKYSYDKVLNHLVLQLSQLDTMKFTDTNITSEGDITNSTYYQVEFMLKPENGGNVVTHPKQEILVGSTLFNNILYRPHRSFVYFGGYAGDGYKRWDEDPACYDQLPARVELLDNKVLKTEEDLVRDGILVRVYNIKDSEGNDIGQTAGVAVPLNMKVRLKKKDGIKVLYGGYGFYDTVMEDDDGNMIPRPRGSEGGVTLSYKSNYMIDPTGCSYDNPRGEFIFWYIDNRWYVGKEHPYEFLFLFDKVGK